MSSRSSLLSLCSGAWLRVSVIGLFSWSSVIYPVLAETAQTPAAEQSPAAKQATTGDAPAADPMAPAKPVFTIGDLEYLLAPIALFPDPLLDLTLRAATVPEQVDEADLWIVNNPQAVERRNFTEIDARDWDPSVQALSRFPEVIEMLARNLDWSQSVGMAFALQPEDVAATIQLLRAKAKDLGNLETTPQQVVTVREENNQSIIYIAPANPVRIYVPSYDPVGVFVSPVPTALAFGIGVLVGSSWNNRWGWNNRRWNTVWVYRPVWRPPPPNWRPGPGRPGVRPPVAWRPDRPGDRPNRPTRPERPNVRPERPTTLPETRPNRPQTRPERPATRPETRPERPATRPATRPQRPETRPERPAARPQQRPAARPERPAARPQQRPTARPQQRPAARPQQRPETRPERPTARPQQRPANRPQQRPANRPPPRERR